MAESFLEKKKTAPSFFVVASQCVRSKIFAVQLSFVNQTVRSCHMFDSEGVEAQGRESDHQWQRGDSQWRDGHQKRGERQQQWQ